MKLEVWRGIVEMNNLLRWASFILFAVSSTAWASAGSVQVEEPWVREGPATARAVAGYMVLRNQGDAEQALVAARCDAFAEVQLHRTVVQDGFAKMVEQSSIVVSPRGVTTFEPNGYHLMLIGPKKSLRAGDKVEITLEFADGTSLPVMYEVKATGGQPMNHGHMEHGHHMPASHAH